MSLIGMLRWIVKLRHKDVFLECSSMLSSHLALPREGPLCQLFQVFACSKKHHNAEMMCDPNGPVVDKSAFDLKDWTSSEFGHNAQWKEELPPNMPEPSRQGSVINGKVDADHVADTVTRQSRTGFVVCLKSAPICWPSKSKLVVNKLHFVRNLWH
jgi:hypothetical protein